MEYKIPESLHNISHSYCPGCGHGIIHRIICEVIDELDIRKKIIAIAPVGCAVFGYFYWNFDTAEAAHGRPPAVATGIKRVCPDKIVMTYQGDGDLAAIGAGEILHAAVRSENISVMFINNGCFGMTGGQMAPTTLMNQKTTTTPEGRTQQDGYPLKICELLSTLKGAIYIERVSVHNPAHIIKAKKAIRKSFQCQIDNKGFSLIEFLSMCPTIWKETPLDSLKTISDKMLKFYPLKVFKDIR